MAGVSGQIIPTGGAIMLQLSTVSGAYLLERAVSGSTGLGPWTILSSGAPGPGFEQRVFIDVGDGLPGPLDPESLYVYQLTDSEGSAQTYPFQPAAEFAINPSPIAKILQRLVQAGLNSLIKPSAVPVAQVLYAMPLAGLPRLPLITFNEDLTQQAEIPVGQHVANNDPFTGIWTITGFQRRSFRISVLATEATTRDFYRTAVISILTAMVPTTLAQIGLNVRHSYQSTSGQVSDEPKQALPGFYFADILYDFTGTFNVEITPTLGLIETIDFTGYLASGAAYPEAEIEVQVPVSGD